MNEGESGTSFGAQLRQLREGAGLSQEELGHQAGLSRAAIGALERGTRRHPHPVTVRLLAEALQLSPDERSTLLVLAKKRAPAGEGPADDLSEVLRPTLPTPLTPLLGREVDVANLIALLGGGARIVTLTGPGGVGKTRLALQVATELREQFTDGAIFVPLAPLSDARLVLSSIAQLIGLHETNNQPLRESLQGALRERQILLLLDNFEHLLDGAADLGPLLEGCPRLVVLATSRAPLRVRGEREYPVAPLALPEFDHAVTAAEAIDSPAVRLFVQLAQAVRPTFALTNDNAATVAAICGRLDGLPPAALLARLHHALSLATGGGRDMPARQRTLRDAISWSHDLLNEREKLVLRRIAVFAGGCTLDAAEAVCATVQVDAIDVLAGVQSLVEKSLLQVQDVPGPPRFTMLETIREYGLEQLTRSGDEAASRAAHARYVVNLVEEINRRLWGPEQVESIARLEAERQNIRAAFRWLLDAGEFEDVGRLLRDLRRFWWMLGQMGEARRWAEEVLDRDVPPSVRAHACLVAGVVAEEQGRAAEAIDFLHETRVLARTCGDQVVEGAILMTEGSLAYSLGDIRAALALARQAHEFVRTIGDDRDVGITLGGLSALYGELGELDKAERYGEAYLELAQRMGAPAAISRAWDRLANVALLRRDYDRMTRLLERVVTLAQEVGNAQLGHALMSFGIAAAEREPERAARCFGAAAQVREASGVAVWPIRRKLYDEALVTVRSSLSPTLFSAAWAEGRAMTREQAVQYALEVNHR